MKNLVIIDPGHGGKDPGATSGQVREKDLVLYCARILWVEAQKRGCMAIITRPGDHYIGLTDRAIIANGYSPYADKAVLISLHHNSVESSTPRGHSVFYSDNVRGKKLSQLIHNGLCNTFPKVPVYNKGVIHDSFLYTGGLTVLRRASVTSVLSEFLFISNQEDRTLLSQADTFEKFSYAVMNGVEKYFNLGV